MRVVKFSATPLVDMIINNNEGIIVVMEGKGYEITIIAAVTVTGILLLLE